MKSFPPIRLAVLVLLALTVAVGGCGKKSKDLPPAVSDLEERDADDLAEYIGASVGSDNGGWWFTIEKACEIIDANFPVPIPPPPGANAQSPGTPARTHTDTVLTQANVTYAMSILYSNFLQVQSAVPDTATDQLEAIVTTSFGSRITNPHVETTYGLILNTNEPTNFSVINLYPGADTLEFSGTVSDSGYALITSSFHAPPGRVWYHYDNFFDYTLFIPKSTLPTASVIGGEVTWLLAARPMPNYSGDRTAQIEDQLASGTLTFDGSQIARLRIADSFEVAEFFYSVNLKTGAVAKLP